MLQNQLLTMARCMAGEFGNREQAIAEPAWYVNLRLWQRPIPSLDGVYLFAEQANVINLHKPYRQRILQLMATPEGELQVQYHAFVQPAQWVGAANNYQLLSQITPQNLVLLADCCLNVSYSDGVFTAQLPADAQCCFSYQGELRQVSLGFAAAVDSFLSFDRGIDRDTGAAFWGAIAGPYRFSKLQDFSSELIL